jgi:hypothetical protein
VKRIDPWTKAVLKSLCAALRLYLEQDQDVCGNRGRCMYCRAQAAIDAAHLLTLDRLL